MKMNKFLFGTLCATALFASCTNDELTALTPEEGIDAKQIEVLLSAKYAESAPETRMALVGNEWAWINGDMIGALRVGELTAAAAENSFNTNYPFELTEALTAPSKTADFKTNTAVYEGLYVFYHQYDGTMVNGGTDGYKVTFPTVQEINPDSLTENLSKNNLFVSPVIKLKGIEYGKANETAIQFVPLYAMLEVKLTNNSTDGDVVVNRVDITGNKIIADGTLNFVSFPVKDPTQSTYASDLEDAIETMNENVNLLETAQSGTGESISAVIKGEGISIKVGETKSVYVLIPAGNYAIKSSEATNQAIKSFTVYTDKGQFKINAEKATAEGTAVSTVTFNHTTLRSLNPKLEGKANPVVEYTINNMDDWNNAVAYAEKNLNQVINFDLKADIEVSELPTCPIYVKSTDSKTLTFAKGSTITLAANSQFTNKVVNNGTLELIEKSSFGELVNNGTIDIANTEKVSAITTLTNNGTINLKGTLTTKGTWTNNYDGKTTFGTVSVENGANLILGAATTNDGVINNAGKIDVAKYVLTNAGEINVATATGKFVGTDNKITNNNAIKLDAIKDVFVDSNDKAVTSSFITSTSTGTVEVAVSPSDIATLPAIQEINAISMSGDWTVKNVKDMNAQWPGIKAMTWEGVSLDLNEVSTEFEDVKSLTINGTSAITTSGTETATLNLLAAENTTITVKGDLTIGENVAITSAGGATATPKMTVLGTVVNSGKVTVSLTVGAEKNTTAKYTNTKDGKTYVKSSSSANDVLTLYGIFINEGTADSVTATKVDFKIQGKSTFTGSYTVPE